MILLVANLGSTSFKFKLFDMADGREAVLAQGDADRIGQEGSQWSVKAGSGRESGMADLQDHGAAIDLLLSATRELGVEEAGALDAIGFKAVHGGPISGAVRVDDEVLSTMEAFVPVAPAHNPPYLAAMRALQAQRPDCPQVACFETAFHSSIPLSRQVYGVPFEWVEKHGVRRYGFHGASHSYIAHRMGELMPKASCVLSLHLGGSSSVCGIRSGKSVYHSMGMTPQSGLFHNNRVGDFDAFAMHALLDGGLSMDEIWRDLAKGGGMLGISGVSPDMRDIEEAAAQGHERAQLALDAFVESCRTHMGAAVMAMGGLDAVVFTGGIGQHGKAFRAQVLENLGFLGVKLDPAKNEAAKGSQETPVHTGDASTAVWVLPTNEELMVARQTLAVLAGAVA